MRRYLVLALAVGLGLSSLGCHRTKQYTAGVCDCNPPPVETLLHQPCPTYHPITNPYPAYTPAPVHSTHAAPGNVRSLPGTTYGANVVVPPAAVPAVPTAVAPMAGAEKLPAGPAGGK